MFFLWLSEVTIECFYAIQRLLSFLMNLRNLFCSTHKCNFFFMLSDENKSELFHKSVTLLETLNLVTTHRMKCVRNVRDPKRTQRKRRPIPTNVFIKLKRRSENEKDENGIFRSFTSWFSMRFVFVRLSCTHSKLLLVVLCVLHVNVWYQRGLCSSSSLRKLSFIMPIRDNSR